MDPLIQKLLIFGATFYFFYKMNIIPAIGNYTGFRNRSGDIGAIEILPLLYCICFSSSLGRFIDLEFKTGYIFVIAFLFLGFIFGLYLILKDASKQVL